MERRTPLRLVMPMLNFVPGGVGGSETVARALIAEMGRRDDVDLTLVVAGVGEGQFGSTRELVASGVAGGSATLDRLKAQVRGAFPDSAARRALRDADVVHYPFTVPVPMTTSPWVHTLLDVQHLDLPHLFSFAERQYRKIAYDLAARRARRVITISEFSKSRIVHHLGVPAERVDVAPLGVDLDRFMPYTGPRQSFVYFPATVWPHKNHKRLIEAMQLVRMKRPELKLVLTGGNAKALGLLPDWVEHRGFVTEVEVAELYRSAACLAYPSLYEGFGLPPLEAMASGCPVAAAESGSLSEVCGDAAAFFDPYDVSAIARGIGNALDHAERRVAAGREWARTFTWARCADGHANAYERALASPTSIERPKR